VTLICDVKQQLLKYCNELQNGDLDMRKAPSTPATMSKQHCRTIIWTKSMLLQHCCRFWQQSRMLLRQSRTLLRHFCWCGRGLNRTIADVLAYSLTLQMNLA